MGGGGGGAAIRTDNVFNFAGDIVRSIATVGLDTASEGDFADTITGETARRAMKEEEGKAREQQAQVEAQVKERDEATKLAKENASKRARQKAMGGGRGRASTILTSPLGGPADAQGSAGKTLLGS